jgi:hypothetical protein
MKGWWWYKTFVSGRIVMNNLRARSFLIGAGTLHPEHRANIAGAAGRAGDSMACPMALSVVSSVVVVWIDFPVVAFFS